MRDKGPSHISCCNIHTAVRNYSHSLFSEVIGPAKFGAYFLNFSRIAMAFWPCSGVYCLTLSASPNPQHRASHMNGIGREVPAPTCFESAGLDQSRREGQKQDSIFGILSAVLCHNHVDCCLADGARPKRGLERGEQLTPMPRETPEMILSRTACCDGTGRDGYS